MSLNTTKVEEGKLVNWEIRDRPPLLSVVIPIFNTPVEFLQRCFDSIARQSYESIEVVAVDDGSTRDYDDWWSSARASFPFEIKFERQHNQGVSAARNRGIELCSGSLVMFVDPDDELAEDGCIRDAVNLIVSENVDIVYGRVSYCFADRSFDYPFDLGECSECIVDDPDGILEFAEYFFSYATRRGSAVPAHLNRGPVARVFKRELLDGVSFDGRLQYAEDAIFNSEVVRRCRSIALVDKVWYRYYQYQSSISHGDKIPTCEAHCDYARRHITCESLTNAYWSYCRHCIIEACVNRVREEGVGSFREVRAFVSSSWVQDALGKFAESCYVIPSWERSLVRLALDGHFHRFFLAILFGCSLLRINRKKPIEVQQ